MNSCVLKKFTYFKNDMHENCPLSDFYEFMKKNPFFVPSIYIYEKLIRFYSKSVPSKVNLKNSIIVPPFIHGNFLHKIFKWIITNYTIVTFVT